MLPLRVPTREGEPAHGLILRLAARHRNPNASEFARDLGLVMSELLAGRGSRVLAGLAGVDENQLSRWTPRVFAARRSVILAGEELWLNDWSDKCRRWCPECLRQDREHGAAIEAPCWHRAIWDVKSVVACPVHNLALVDRCPRCATSQDFSGPSVGRCWCGADLSLSPRRPWQSPSSVYIADRLWRCAVETPLIDQLKLKDAIAALERIGHVVSRGRLPRRPRSDGHAAALARDEGASALRGWPATFVVALDRVAAEARQSGVCCGMIGTYGWIYSAWAATDLPEPLRSSLRSTLSAHAAAHGVIAPGERLFGARASRHPSLTSAAHQLGVGFSRARQIAGQIGLIPKGARRGVPVSLSNAAFGRLQVRLAPRVRLHELSKVLGTSRQQASALRASGAIDCQLAADGSEAAVAYALIARLRSACTGAVLGAEQARCLPDGCRAFGIPLVRAVEAALAGRLTLRERFTAAVGLRRFVACENGLRCLRPHPDGLTFSRASKLIGVHPEALRPLVRLGLLRQGRKSGLDPHSVSAFRNKFVPNTAVAASLGTSPRAAVQRLRFLKVSPAVDRSTCRAIFFDRKAVIRLGLELAA